MSQTTSRATVYEIVTERILGLLDQGTVPWRRPWNPERPLAGTPVNIRGTHYRGSNRMLLAALGYESPVWLTFKQCQEHGGTVRKGEHGMPVIFWKIEQERVVNGVTQPGSFLLRYYTAFNLAQTDGVTLPASLVMKLATDGREHQPISEAQAIVDAYIERGPTLMHGGDQACYSPTFDQVRMPEGASFADDPSYYRTLFHELGHSTGHASRLNRDGVTSPIAFGSHTYSREELVAEMTACFLAEDCALPGGVDGDANSAAYIASWVKVLQGDPKAVITAAGQAQKATDHILGVSFAKPQAAEGEEEALSLAA